MQESGHVAIVFGTIGLSLAIATICLAVVMVKLVIEAFKNR